MTKNKLRLTRGLPGSGKSTWARKFVKANPGTVRLNRDDFRLMLFGLPVLSGEQEDIVTVAQHGAVTSALKAGHDVIVDDTNFYNPGVKKLMNIAAKANATVIFHDFTDVPIEECIRRDADRDAMVGEGVIRKMYNRYMKDKDLPLEIPSVGSYELFPYWHEEHLPWAVIVDIDGTVAKMADRSPYEWHRVGEDIPVFNVLEAVRAMAAQGHSILFTSGRDGSCREVTAAWLDTNYGQNYTLLMRREKDNRPDWIVKAEIFDTQIRGRFNIRMVFDDRNQVVDMWRNMGLTVAQVAEGDF